MIVCIIAFKKLILYFTLILVIKTEVNFFFLPPTEYIINNKDVQDTIVKTQMNLETIKSFVITHMSYRLIIHFIKIKFKWYN